MVLAIRNNSEIAKYSEMLIPSGSTCASDKLYSRAAQPEALGPHLAREAFLCGPRGLLRA